MKISVIIPVYQAESYIKKCVDSFIRQSLSDFEILLVDDGSLDKSGVICDEYAKQDSRIKVFHKKNGGVASARQLGLEKAKGEYIIHADPDDWVEPNMLMELYLNAKETNADIVICDFYYNDNVVIKQQPSDLNHLAILHDIFVHLHGSCCNKLIKRTCILKYSPCFYEELTYCEDVAFWIQLLKHPVKISYTPHAYYHYIQYSNPNSIVHNYVNLKKDVGWYFVQILRKELSDYPDLKKHACGRAAFTIVNDALKYGNYNSISFFKRYCKYIDYIWDYGNIGIKSKFYYTLICLGLLYNKKRKKMLGK